MQKRKTKQFKDTVFSAVHDALVAFGIPETNHFERVLELEAEDFRFDTTYPDLTRPRNEDFVLIEIVLSVGRRVSVKQKIVQDIVSKLSSQGFEAERVMVHLDETRWENWSLGGGRFQYM